MRSAGATRPAIVFHHIEPPEPNEWSRDRKKPFTMRRAIGPSASCRSWSVTDGGPASGASFCHQGVSFSPAFSPTAGGSPGPPLEADDDPAVAYGLSSSLDLARLGLESHGSNLS